MRKGGVMKEILTTIVLVLCAALIFLMGCQVMDYVWKNKKLKCTVVVNGTPMYCWISTVNTSIYNEVIRCEYLIYETR